MSTYEKIEVNRPDLSHGRAKLAELKRLEAKRKVKSYPILNGHVETGCPDRWREHIINK